MVKFTTETRVGGRRHRYPFNYIYINECNREEDFALRSYFRKKYGCSGEWWHKFPDWVESPIRIGIKCSYDTRNALIEALNWRSIELLGDADSNSIEEFKNWCTERNYFFNRIPGYQGTQYVTAPLESDLTMSILKWSSVS